MITPADTDLTLRPLAIKLREQIPTFKILVANAYAIRGKTAKGSYEIRIFIKNGEIRTSFLRRGSNPLKSMQLLCRNCVSGAEKSLDEHLAAIQANEEKLPWIKKELDPEDGDESVSILPFGAAENAPRVVIRTSARTGILSLDVLDAREMSPVEARLIGKAINRACKIAALGPEN